MDSLPTIFGGNLRTSQQAERHEYESELHLDSCEFRWLFGGGRIRDRRSCAVLQPSSSYTGRGARNTERDIDFRYPAHRH